MPFADRNDAADRLVDALRAKGAKFDVVIALPRGGVVLGVEIAKAFHVPFDLIIPRKIGAQYNEEYAIGAVLEDGTAAWNEREKLEADPAWLETAIQRERTEAGRRREAYLGTRARVDLHGKTALIVDDGIATGLTMRLAVTAAKQGGADKIFVAVPVAPSDSAAELEKSVDKVFVLETPEFFGSIGAFYDRFEQVTDAEAIEMMKRV